MFYRVRARLADSPGALARLAKDCGDAEVNILALQIYPELGAVTDDLVVETPDAWTAAAVVELVSGAGGDEVSVVPCATHDLTRLLGARVSWSAAEQVRAEALVAIADRVRLPAAPTPTAATTSVVEYDAHEAGVIARIGQHVVGAATLHALVDGAVEAGLEVAPAWRRLGIGRELLGRLSGLAAARGAREMVLLAPPSEEGVVPVLAAAGMRGRIRLTEHGLTVHISLAGVQPVEEPVGR